MPNQEEFDIDHLKEAWQSQPVEKSYEESEIEVMLNHKSRNYVKYILWVSIAEFLIFGFLNFAVLYTDDSHSNFENILNKLQIKNQSQIEFSLDKMYFWIKIISLIVTGVFVALFYNKYKRIHVEENLKKFIKHIIGFKNTVNLFIVLNVILLVTSIGAFMSFLIITIRQQNIVLDNPTLLALVFAVTLALLISVLLILFYYKIAYGILLKRLSNNLKQLEQIDSEKS